MYANMKKQIQNQINHSRQQEESLFFAVFSMNEDVLSSFKVLSSVDVNNICMHYIKQILTALYSGNGAKIAFPR